MHIRFCFFYPTQVVSLTVRPHNVDKKLTLSPTLNLQTQNYQSQIKATASEKVEILEIEIKNTNEKPLQNWLLTIGAKTFYPTENLELPINKNIKTRVQSLDNLEKLVEKNDPVELINCKNCEITIGKSEIKTNTQNLQDIWLTEEIYRQQQNFELASYSKFANPLLISSFVWKNTLEPKCESLENTKTCQLSVDFYYYDTQEIVESNYGKNAKLLNYEIKNPKIAIDKSLEGQLWLTASVNYDLDYGIIREIIKKNNPETAKIQLQESFPNIKKVDFYSTGLPLEYQFLYIETK